MSGREILRIERLDSHRAGGRSFVRQLLVGRRAHPASATKLRSKVERILADVAREGDRALIRWTEKFDGVSLRPTDFRVRRREIERAYRAVSRDELEALTLARKNIEKAEGAWLRRLPGREIHRQGVAIRSWYAPLSSVGCYVPGGKAIYPSSVLMSVIPAKLAGVRRIVLCTPPIFGTKKVHPLVLVAADQCGVDEIYRIGGAQAIAAMAFGTETIQPVEKIVGPGSSVVATAKQLVSDRVAIDMLAGASELVVLADETGHARAIAWDLISQAEHGGDSVCGLVTTSRALAEEVKELITRLLPRVARRELVTTALKRHGFAVYDEDIDRLIEFVNEFAPEHLEIMMKDGWQVARRITSAGLILVGTSTSVVLTDYMVGTNHVLPTGGWARRVSGLSAFDFLKRMTAVECSLSTLDRFVTPVGFLARAEGLPNHYAALVRRWRDD